MSEFEFVAVLVSIIFGLAITQVLTGTVRLLYGDHIDDVHLAWALMLILGLVVNWWGFFRWSDLEQWRLEIYVFLILWAIVHYATAAALFPRNLATAVTPRRERVVFLSMLLALFAIDTAEAGVRGELSSPWFFPWTMGHWAVVVSIPLFVQGRAVERAVAWYMFASILIWSVVVRRLLGG